MKHTLFKICICVQMNTDLKNNLTCCCCCCCHSAFNNQYDAYLKKNKNPKLVNLLTGLKISSWKASLPNKVYTRYHPLLLLLPPRSYQLDNVPTPLFSRYPRTTCFHHCFELPRAEYNSLRVDGWVLFLLPAQPTPCTVFTTMM